MWTLIIILALQGGAVDHIDGFVSKQSCEVAAAVVNQHESATARNYTTLACVTERQ